MNLTSPADTLVCDTAQIALWQSDPAYNYNRELITPEMNIFEWISRQFGELMRKIFGSRFAEEYSGLILICIAILILLLIVWFLYRKRPELFMVSRKNALILPASMYSGRRFGLYMIIMSCQSGTKSLSRRLSF